MNIITLIFALWLWNWLGGLVFGIVLGVVIVAPFLARMNKDPDNAGKVRAYCRAVGTNHLLNHLATVTGSALLCAASTADGATPPWLAWPVFGIYVLFWRLTHILDSAHKMITGDGVPAATFM